MSCESELILEKTKPAKTSKLDFHPRVPSLTPVYTYITGSCNIACRHCWINPTYEPDNSKGQFPDLKLIKKAVREAKPLGLCRVKFFDGEPMIHSQFREIAVRQSIK